MSLDRGPWTQHRGGGPAPRPPRGPGLAVLALLVGVAALVGLLFKLFPGAVSSGEDWALLAQGLGLLVLVSAGVFTAGRIKWGETARHLAIWAGIIGVLVLVVTYRDELAGVGLRVRSEFSSSYPVATGDRELAVTQDEDGGFYLMGQVNGHPVRFLVDTGASETVLSPADAKRLGIDVGGLQFNQAAETANGVGYGASYTADSLAVGPIDFSDFPMVVNQAPMRHSLLGMTFLRRLESFQVTGRKLYLKSR